MACKKAEFISAINSFGNAVASGDNNLIALSSGLLAQLLETLEFAAEDESQEEEETEVKKAEPA